MALQSASGERATSQPTRRNRSRPRRRHGLGWVTSLGVGLCVLGLGAALGLGLTAAALRNGAGVGTVMVGAWQLAPQIGTPAINPYQRAALARSAAVPMSAGQGVALTASRDDAGKKLNRRCSYVVSGPVPRARFWTLGALDAQGFPIANAADRYAFTSESLLRDESGAVAIAVSPEPQPGNWLPLGGDGPFTLTLRLYDSAIQGLGRRELSVLKGPSIRTADCAR